MNAVSGRTTHASGSAAYFLERALEPIRQFLDDSNVVEISLNRPHNLYVEYLGDAHMAHFEIPELTAAEIQNIGERVAAVTSQFVSRAKPLLSAALPTGERIQVILPPAAPAGGAFSIRKQVVNDLSLEHYHKSGALDRVAISTGALTGTDLQLIEYLKTGDIYAFLQLAIRSRISILISGGTSSGKTTFLNACLKAVDANERIITLEDTRELFPPQHNSLHLLASKGDQGTADVTIQHLLEASLRMRPDRLFVGEIRGAEAFSFLRAINTGHPGSMTTVHADTPKGAYEQLVMMMMQSGFGASFSKADLLDYLRMVIPIVIQLRREGGKRGVSEIFFARQPA